MPHAGGGGGFSGGGFHSSSSSHSSVPKFDHSGRPHSSYYIRPGFYYHHIFVDYDREKRRTQAITGPIVMLVFALLFLGIFTMGFLSETGYSEDNLEGFAIERYYDIYDDSSKNFEDNLLVTIVAYEDKTQYDYITIVGDNVNYKIDRLFGNQYSEFGELVFENVKYDDYYDSLYLTLSSCLNELNSTLDKKYCLNNELNSKIVNTTTFGEIQGENELKQSCKDFYDITGYQISFIVCDSRIAYQFEWVPFILVTIFMGVFIAVSIVLLIKNLDAVKQIGEAEKNGTAKEYFEGEDDYDTHIKNNPQDDPYDWKKDFEE